MRVDDQRSHGAVLDHEGKLRPGEAEIERYEDRTDPRAAEHHKEEHRLVDSKKCDPVAFLDAERSKPFGAVFDLELHVGVGPVASFEVQRSAFRRAQRALTEPIPESDVRSHPLLPS
jgi:hypothetical protein